ncbi:MAG: ABC transporter substrate-binding protein [Clostridiales bacterium]|nr:ABC transporter substrate-binding protein [Clostridiales bacterium]
MKKAVALILAMVMALGMVSAAAQEETFTIGICQFDGHVALEESTQGFMDAITEVLGDRAIFDEQDAAGEISLCSTIVNNFVVKDVDLILANSTPALQTAASATYDIPILGTSVTEYGAALDIADFYGIVGYNVSGTSDLAPLDKQAAMITTLFPEAQNVGLLYCSSEANSDYQVKVVSELLTKAEINVKEFPFMDTSDIAAVCYAACEFSDVIYVPTDNVVASSAAIVDGVCRPMGVPVIGGDEGICSACGVATLCISYYELGYTTGKMALRILLDGEDVATMPIEYAPVFMRLYNSEICAELGITPPEEYVEIGTTLPVETEGIESDTKN